MSTTQLLSDNRFNNSLAKGLQVLFAFKGSNKSMSLTETARALGMSVSSTQRILYTLEALELVSRSNETKKYSLTLKVLELAHHLIAADTLVEIANPFIAELSNTTGETVNLTRPFNDEMVYISRVVSPNYIPVHMPLGSRIPMYCTAAGRAYLGALKQDSAEEIIKNSNLKKYTRWTETNPDKLMDIIRKFRQTRIAYNKEELFLGDMTLATVIPSQNGAPIACVHLVAPTARWTLQEAKKKLTPPLLHCARGIANAARSIG